MMHALVVLHRWLGVAFCLLFAMWFASGIVMHFVPFPSLTEAERFAGLPVIDLTAARHGPAEAMAASGLGDATRVRMLQRPDGPVYLVAGSAGRAAVHASDLSDATVSSEKEALSIAQGYARLRQLDAVRAAVVGLAPYDQWTVPNGFDPHRPLYRVAVNDPLGTELYVSSGTGEVVLDTTRRERTWNYVGSVAHWIYPTALRSHPTVWGVLVWWLSLLALIGATAGAAVGTLQIRIAEARLMSPYDGWQAWHHWLGLICMTFVLTWIFSGWLSMDGGRLFSNGRTSVAEMAAVAGFPAWSTLSSDALPLIGPQAREVEWFAFGGRIYRRERTGLHAQSIAVSDSQIDPARVQPFLDVGEVEPIANRLSPACKAPVIVDREDSYRLAATMQGSPVFRLVCGPDWFDIDGASGVLMQKLDSSRRVYRWLYTGLHTLDFPALTARPALRTTLILALSGCGLLFSLTGVVIAGRRLASCFR
jgi:PepSY-associated TM region